jgi:CRISPR/Cas system-associated protein endoribonuclease Cas2
MWISDYIASGLKRKHVFVDCKKIKNKKNKQHQWIKIWDTLPFYGQVRFLTLCGKKKLYCTFLYGHITIIRGIIHVHFKAKIDAMLKG